MSTSPRVGGQKLWGCTTAQLSKPRSSANPGAPGAVNLCSDELPLHSWASREQEPCPASL